MTMASSISAFPTAGALPADKSLPSKGLPKLPLNGKAPLKPAPGNKTLGAGDHKGKKTHMEPHGGKPHIDKPPVKPEGMPANKPLLPKPAPGLLTKVRALLGKGHSKGASHNETAHSPRPAHNEAAHSPKPAHNETAHSPRPAFDGTAHSPRPAHNKLKPAHSNKPKAGGNKGRFVMPAAGKSNVDKQGAKPDGKYTEPVNKTNKTAEVKHMYMGGKGQKGAAEPKLPLMGGAKPLKKPLRP